MAGIQIVLWLDSTEQFGWNEQHDLPKVAECSTVGYLIFEDDRQVVMASSKDKTNGNLSGVIAIPKVAISERCPVPSTEQAVADARRTEEAEELIICGCGKNVEEH